MKQKDAVVPPLSRPPFRRGWQPCNRRGAGGSAVAIPQSRAAARSHSSLGAPSSSTAAAAAADSRPSDGEGERGERWVVQWHICGRTSPAAVAWWVSVERPGASPHVDAAGLRHVSAGCEGGRGNSTIAADLAFPTPKRGCRRRHQERSARGHQRVGEGRASKGANREYHTWC